MVDTPFVDPNAPPEVPNPWQSSAFLEDPRMRGALLQAGINLMQPPSFGDNAASLLGRAIGGGAESVSRKEAIDRAQQEAESKAALREAQATAAGSRSEASTARLGTAAQSLELKKHQLEALNARNDFNTRARLFMAYGKEASNPLRTGPMPSFEEWVAKVAPSTTATDTTISSPDEIWPGVPRDPKKRVAGQVYPGPRGDIRWNGTGWDAP